MSFGIAKTVPIIVMAACFTLIPEVQAATPAPPNSPSPAAPASISFVTSDLDEVVTGDWEETGVQSDIQVPSDQALDEALNLARVKTAGHLELAKMRWRLAKESEHASA